MTSTSTQGLQLRSGAAWWRDTIELLSSMRFAIALLTVICIASVIGTVITQHQPYNNYINQFGPFWAQVFRASGWADDAQSLLSEWTEERQALQDHFNSVRAARTKALLMKELGL